MSAVTKKEVVAWIANCYIVGSETTKPGLIIDPGDGADTVLAAVEELGLDIKVVRIRDRPGGGRVFKRQDNKQAVKFYFG